MTNQQQSQCSFLYQANWFQFSQQFSQHGTNINMKTKTGVMEKELRVRQVSARREEKGVQTDFVVYFGNTSLCFKMREKCFRNTFKKKIKKSLSELCASLQHNSDGHHSDPLAALMLRVQRAEWRMPPHWALAAGGLIQSRGKPRGAFCSWPDRVLDQTQGLHEQTVCAIDIRYRKEAARV